MTTKSKREIRGLNQAYLDSSLILKCSYHLVTYYQNVKPYEVVYTGP